MSLIIRETVVTECQGLAREVEVAVRKSTTNPLDDTVIEKICETHVKKIVDDATVQIEKQVEEREYQRDDSYKLQQSTEMYNSKKSDITELVNVRIIRRDDPDNPDFHQLNGLLHHLRPRVRNDSDKYEEDLDPKNAIEVTEISSTANIDDVDDQDLLDHDADSEFWEDYQTSYDVEVDQPLDEFYNCNQRVVNLLQTHCKSRKQIVKLLGILSTHGDYSGVNNINLLYDLAKFMLALPQNPNLHLTKRRRISSPIVESESTSDSSTTSTTSSSDTIPFDQEDERVTGTLEENQNEMKKSMELFNIDEYGSFTKLLGQLSDSAEQAIDEENQVKSKKRKHD